MSGAVSRHLIISGVTVLRGVGGYGSSTRGRGLYHTTVILRLSQDLPIVIETVEYSERIEKALAQVDGIMVDGGLVTLEKV